MVLILGKRRTMWEPPGLASLVRATLVRPSWSLRRESPVVEQGPSSHSPSGDRVGRPEVSISRHQHVVGRKQKAASPLPWLLQLYQGAADVFP